MNGHPIDQYQDFLHDESRLKGTADRIFFPENENELRRMCHELNRLKIPMTVQGARTGIVGGAVPLSGAVINLKNMNKILGLRYDSQTKQFFLRVQPGLVLKDLRRAIETMSFDLQTWDEESLYAFDQMKNKAPLFFPPDPTEDTASIGGMAASNASGALSFYYGSVRNYIQSLRLVMSDGDLLFLERKANKAQGRQFTIQSIDGKELKGRLPSYNLPDTKNTAGYYVKDNMDMIDLFIGAEGTLGIISELELVLREKPTEIWGAVIFWESEAQSLAFIKRINQMDSMGLRGPQALEYFDVKSISLLQLQKKENPAFHYLPLIPEKTHDAVYLEFHGPNLQLVEDSFDTVCEFIGEIGGDVDDSWLADNSVELERMKQFRHALPEAVNRFIDEKRKYFPGITKLGTDMAVPDSHLEDIFLMYKQRLKSAGLEYVMFGHIGNNHLHINIIPNSEEEYKKGKKEYLSMARQVVQWQGTVAAEHGIGKIKKDFLKMMYHQEGIQEMRAIKSLFDPSGLLNKENLF